MSHAVIPTRAIRLLPVFVALALGLALGLAGCATHNPQPHETAPRASTATTPIAATANPLATQAALRMLAQGGSAVDAAVAAQMVLGLVEPQSSGLGGGTLALHWEAATGTLSSIDGLAAAPARTTAGLNIDTDGTPLASELTRRGGRSVGVPGTLALFEQLHARHGKLPWAVLFQPAIALAEQGFAMPRYLHEVLSAAPRTDVGDAMRALYFGADGRVLPAGATLRNPAYAQTLRAIAERGPRGWLVAGAAQRLAQAAQQGPKPGFIAEADVLAYRPEAREPLCRTALRHRVCVAGPASFGGVVVLQMLNIVEQASAAGAMNFDDPAFVHRYAEAGRLAQADRQRYLGDPAYVHVPLQQMLEPLYLQFRAQRIDPQHAMPEAPAGAFAQHAAALAPDTHEFADATSQMAIVDAQGNALSVTTTINLNFGSWLMVDGYVLNNAMTNFSNAPPPGQARANQMAPGKRPITSMSPTIVFDERQVPVVVGGSAGGGQIVDYISASLIELLANGRTPEQALARGHVSTAISGTVQLEKGTPAAEQTDALRAKGHTVTVTEMKSGLAFVKREGNAWTGAADPRRDGSAQPLQPSP